jgi:hypothetical protein
MIASRFVIDILLPFRPHLIKIHQSSQPFMWMIIALAAAVVIQTDTLRDDRAFWLTRPLTWRDVLAGKLLLLFSAVNLPILIFQFIALAAMHLSPLNHLFELVQTQIYLSSILLLFALLASATRNLGQYILGAVAAVVALAILIPQTLSGTLYNMDWGSAESLRPCIAYGPFIPVALLLLCIQYSRRMPKRILAIAFIAFSLSSLASYSVSFWRPLAHLRAKMAGVWRNHSPVQIEFRPNQSPTFLVGWAHSRKPTAALLMPVRVTGIPQGRELSNERMNFKVTSQDGSSWETGWMAFGGVFKIDTEPSYRFITGDGDCSLAANMDWNIFNRIQNDPVRIKASLALRLTSPFVIPMPEDRLSFTNKIAGFSGKSRNQAICLFSKAPLGIVEAGFSKIALISEDASGTIWRYAAKTYRDPLYLHKEEAWFETTLEIPQIRLKDYLYRRFD